MDVVKTPNATALKTNSIQVSPEQDIDYFTIEGMRSQGYSQGIFIFMVVGVVVFLAILFKFMFGSQHKEKMKTGEMVLFIWIIVGTIAAVIMGALQLLQGQLF